MLNKLQQLTYITALKRFKERSTNKVSMRKFALNRKYEIYSDKLSFASYNYFIRISDMNFIIIFTSKNFKSKKVYALENNGITSSNDTLKNKITQK